MNSDATYSFQGQGPTLAGKSGRLTRQVIRLAVILLLAATAYAQYGGGGGTTGGTMGTSGTTGASTDTVRPSALEWERPRQVSAPFTS